MTEYDIQTDKDRPYRDKDVLTRLYWDEYLSQKEVAAVLDADPATISRWMDKFDIRKRTNSERQVAHRKLLDEEWLRDKYHGEMLSITEVSELLDISRMPVQRALDRHGIEAHGHGYKVANLHAGYRMAPTGYMVSYAHYYDENGDQKQDEVRIHRLMAVAEHGVDAVAGMEVHHKNGVTFDNRPENLELLSKADHAKHHFEERGGLQPWQAD